MLKNKNKKPPSRPITNAILLAMYFKNQIICFVSNIKTIYIIVIYCISSITFILSDHKPRELRFVCEIIVHVTRSACIRTGRIRPDIRSRCSS